MQVFHQLVAGYDMITPVTWDRKLLVAWDRPQLASVRHLLPLAAIQQPGTLHHDKVTLKSMACFVSKKLSVGK